MQSTVVTVTLPQGPTLPAQGWPWGPQSQGKGLRRHTASMGSGCPGKGGAGQRAGLSQSGSSASCSALLFPQPQTAVPRPGKHRLGCPSGVSLPASHPPVGCQATGGSLPTWERSLSPLVPGADWSEGRDETAVSSWGATGWAQCPDVSVAGW